MTLTEKLMARAAGRDQVSPGEMITCEIDFLMANDITAPLSIEAFETAGASRVFDKERIALVLSHFVPARDSRSAEQCRVVREFAKRHELPYFFDEGRGGIEHALLPQEGLVGPGDIVLGADSHSCTYGGLGCFATGVGSTDLAAAMITGKSWFRVPESIRIRFDGELDPWVSAKDMVLETIGAVGADGASWSALEFCGEAVEALSIEQRLTLCNMAIEAGAKNGIVAADETTEQYMRGRAKRPWFVAESDPDASYASERVFRADELTPKVAFPFSPDRVHGVEAARGVSLNQVFIGSCTNARIEDLRIAAGIMRGREIDRGLRCIVIPATAQIYRQALAEGLIEIFSNAGCVITDSTCGPCLGGHFGVLGRDEVCLSTSNRNFPGRMGHPEARVYLSSPAVAAASAIAGTIVHPGEVAGSPKESESA